MAKKSTIEKNERRKRMAAKQAAKRKALTDTVRSLKVTEEAQPRLYLDLRVEPYRLPRDGAAGVDPRRPQGELV